MSFLGLGKKETQKLGETPSGKQFFEAGPGLAKEQREPEQERKLVEQEPVQRSNSMPRPEPVQEIHRAVEAPPREIQREPIREPYKEPEQEPIEEEPTGATANIVQGKTAQVCVCGNCGYLNVL